MTARSLNLWQFAIARAAAAVAERVERDGVDGFDDRELARARFAIRWTLNHALETGAIEEPALRRVLFAAGILEVAVPAARKTIAVFPPPHRQSAGGNA